MGSWAEQELEAELAGCDSVEEFEDKLVFKEGFAEEQGYDKEPNK